jgi:hypothetical protein
METTMTSNDIYTPFIPDQYCVYHTIYSGNLLPQNYIGSSSVDNVLNKNYHGSVVSERYGLIWLSELKLHPELFSTVIVSYHDTRSNATYKELQVQRTLNVVKSNLFINRSYAVINGWCDTIYTPEEQVSKNKKISETKNNKSPEEKASTSKKMSDADANRTTEQKAAISKKRLETYNNKSLKEKATLSKKQSEGHANRSPEEKAATKIKTAESIFNKSPEEMAIWNKKKSDSGKGKPKTPFLSMIHNQKTYAKSHLSKYFPEMVRYY